MQISRDIMRRNVLGRNIKDQKATSGRDRRDKFIVGNLHEAAFLKGRLIELLGRGQDIRY
jgi:hypothetical protein